MEWGWCKVEWGKVEWDKVEWGKVEWGKVEWGKVRWSGVYIRESPALATRKFLMTYPNTCSCLFCSVPSNQATMTNVCQSRSGTGTEQHGMISWAPCPLASQNY